MFFIEATGLSPLYRDQYFRRYSPGVKALIAIHDYKWLVVKFEQKIAFFSDQNEYILTLSRLSSDVSIR
jgi:hypothetical protein